MAKFETGAIVALKSGGPNMTAGTLTEVGYVTCFWFDQNQSLQSVTLHEDLLVEAVV